jgi:putative membrane protein
MEDDMKTLCAALAGLALAGPAIAAGVGPAASSDPNNADNPNQTPAAGAARAGDRTLLEPAMADSADADTSFVYTVAQSDLFEIMSSEAAVQISENADVRDFAETMIRDHTMSSQKLIEAAAQENLAPPIALDAKHQQMLNDIQAADEESFDAAYIEAQEMAHMDAVKLFEDYALQGDGGPLQTFAEQTLPTLQMHLTHVQDLSAKMRGDTAVGGPLTTREPASAAPSARSGADIPDDQTQ